MLDFRSLFSSIQFIIGAKHERNMTKMRLLTFLQIAENQKEMTFEAIEKGMQIPPEDIESFIIEGNRTMLFVRHTIRCY
jgi:translation initiation factor 3 subunit M